MSTPTTQQRIDEKSQEWADHEWGDLIPLDREAKREHKNCKTNFVEGANFVLDTILPEVLEWLKKQPITFDGFGYYHDITGEGLEIKSIIENFLNPQH
jgi:hypothetical protein